MMAEFPALPVFTDAFIGDTTHLTAAQTGAYIMLLMIAWRTHDCALPDDDEKLHRWARMDRRTWLVQKPNIMAFWRKGEDGLWRQGRLSDERKRADDVRSKNAKAGLASALKRNERHSTNVQPKSNVNSTPSPSPSPSPSPKSFTNVKDPPYPQAFERSFEAFPPQRKGAKSGAFKAWSVAVKKTTAEEIHAAILRYGVSGDVQRGFAKGFAAWLNDERWTDRPVIAPAPASPNRKPAYGDILEDGDALARHYLQNRDQVRSQAD